MTPSPPAKHVRAKASPRMNNKSMELNMGDMDKVIALQSPACLLCSSVFGILNCFAQRLITIPCRQLAAAIHAPPAYQRPHFGSAPGLRHPGMSPRHESRLAKVWVLWPNSKISSRSVSHSPRIPLGRRRRCQSSHLQLAAVSASAQTAWRVCQRLEGMSSII